MGGGEEQPEQLVAIGLSKRDQAYEEKKRRRAAAKAGGDGAAPPGRPASPPIPTHAPAGRALSPPIPTHAPPPAPSPLVPALTLGGPAQPESSLVEAPALPVVPLMGRRAATPPQQQQQAPAAHAALFPPAGPPSSGGEEMAALLQRQLDVALAELATVKEGQAEDKQARQAMEGRLAALQQVKTNETACSCTSCKSRRQSAYSCSVGSPCRRRPPSLLQLLPG